MSKQIPVKSSFYFSDKIEWRTNLKKYYKLIFTCVSCKKLFGSDSKNIDPLCPVCLLKLRKLKHE